jgi:hypothetical protein
MFSEAIADYLNRGLSLAVAKLHGVTLNCQPGNYRDAAGR